MPTPRAGTVARVDYPLVPTSELVVRLSFRRQSGDRAALSAVRLQLVPASGEAMPGITEFDGTAVFDAIRPGTYRIELDPAQAARLGMALAQPLAVTVTGNGAPAQVQGEIVFRKESST